MIRSISRTVALQGSSFRNFHITAISRLREIVVEKKDEKTTVVSCKFVKSPREPHILKNTEKQKTDKCPLCKLQLNLKYTDVLILSQYLNSKGYMIEPWNTDLCNNQYRLVRNLIYMAQHAGLLPEPESDVPKKPYRLLNTYYDEKTIVLNPKRVKHHQKFYYLSSKLAPLEKFRINPKVGPYYGPKVH